MVMQHTIPMLFYDCMKRTYKFTDWKDIRASSNRNTRAAAAASTNSAPTPNNDSGHGTASNNSSTSRRRQRRVLTRALSLSNGLLSNRNATSPDRSIKNNNESKTDQLPSSIHSNLTTNDTKKSISNHNDNWVDDNDDVSSTQEESSVGSYDDEEDAIMFQQWESRLILLRQASAVTATPSLQLSSSVSTSASTINNTLDTITTKPPLTTPEDKNEVNDDTEYNDIIVNNRKLALQELEVQSQINHQLDRKEASGDESSCASSINQRLIDEASIKNEQSRDLFLGTSDTKLRLDNDDPDLISDSMTRPPPIPTIPFISLDIEWENFGLKHNRLNKFDESDNNFCDNDIDSYDDRNDTNNDDHTVTENDHSNKPIVMSSKSRLFRTNKFLRKHYEVPGGDQSEPPAGAVALSNFKLRIPIPSYISFVRNNKKDKGHSRSNTVHENNKKKQVLTIDIDDTLETTNNVEEGIKKHKLNDHCSLNADISGCSSTYGTEAGNSGSEDSNVLQYDVLSSSDPLNTSQSSFDSMDDILDPTEPLIYGSISECLHHSLYLASGEMFALLTQLHDVSPSAPNDHIRRNSVSAVAQKEDAICILIEQYPVVCQVKYQLPGFRGPCYPVSYFCSIGSVRCLNVAYTAYPESIGHSDRYVGTPLHYALMYNKDDLELIQSLLRLFPEAVRIPNHHVEKQSPLHFACALYQNLRKNEIGTSNYHIQNTIFYKPTGYSFIPNRQVVNLMLQYYPTAIQTQDEIYGMTPVHALCQYQILDDDSYNDEANLIKILQSFIETSPMVIHSVTTDMQKPLHVAASSGAPVAVLQLLNRYDPSQVKFTDDHFQTPLHKAVIAYAAEESIPDCIVKSDEQHIRGLEKLQENIIYLIELCPDGIYMADENDETPYDVAKRLGCSYDILDLLL